MKLTINTLKEHLEKANKNKADDEEKMEKVFSIKQAELEKGKKRI